MCQIVLRHLGMPPQSAENELTTPQVLEALGRFREDLAVVVLGMSASQLGKEVVAMVWLVCT